MHKIKLVPDRPFHNNCDITVFDTTGGEEKKRCKITVEYARDDIEQLQKMDYGHEQTLQYYDQWIYNTIKRYIADDWECTEGYEQIMTIVDEHIKGYF